MDNVLRITDLSVEYKQYNNKMTIVNRLSFQVNKAEIFGIIGESGCGKSTTALSIAGLLPDNITIASGAISFLGKDLATLSKRGRLEYLGKEIGFIFQDPITSLNPLMKIGEQISERLYLYSDLDKNQIENRVSEVLSEVGLPNGKEFLVKYPHELSGGMRQRVMIAIALVNNPKLIIADEPTTSLDSTIQAQILYLLTKIRDKYGCTILLISHDFGVVNQICDKVAVMYSGQIVESADTLSLLKIPVHPYTIGLMASIPHVNKKGEALTGIPGTVRIADNHENQCVFAHRCIKSTEKCFSSKPTLIHISQDHYYRCFVEQGGGSNAECNAFG